MLTYREKRAIDNYYKDRTRKNHKVNTDYFDKFINDCIKDLRRNMNVYVFKKQHVIELRKIFVDIEDTELEKGIILICREKI